MYPQTLVSEYPRIPGLHTVGPGTYCMYSLVSTVVIMLPFFLLRAGYMIVWLYHMAWEVDGQMVVEGSLVFVLLRLVCCL